MWADCQKSSLEYSTFPPFLRKALWSYFSCNWFLNFLKTSKFEKIFIYNLSLMLPSCIIPIEIESRWNTHSNQFTKKLQVIEWWLKSIFIQKYCWSWYIINWQYIFSITGGYKYLYTNSSKIQYISHFRRISI